MKSMILVALALVAVAVAAPGEEPTKIVSYTFGQQPDGPYDFFYKSEDGSKEALDEDNKPHKDVVVRGSYSYLGEDGKLIIINYSVDESGYHAEEDSIPKVAWR